MVVEGKRFVKSAERSFLELGWDDNKPSIVPINRWSRGLVNLVLALSQFHDVEERVGVYGRDVVIFLLHWISLCGSIVARLPGELP